MTMQEWKAKINALFQPKTQAERQKMMKYVIVMPAAILCGIVVVWLLYSSLKGDEDKTGNAFNTEIPDGENDGMKSKAEEYMTHVSLLLYSVSPSAKQRDLY